ncbi:hypothetical protein F4779DRAFT_18997 [Xylariaceae sp. FL0662B]|nr:hypothetical protein F4779DRAFT_18997 [Xylariaceae sp. FL0662B]
MGNNMSSPREGHIGSSDNDEKWVLVANNEQKAVENDTSKTVDEDEQPTDDKQQNGDGRDDGKQKIHKKKSVSIVDPVRLEALCTESVVYELDENNVIQGIHAETSQELPRLPKSSLPGLPPSYLVESEEPRPPKWRSHKEIAIEVSEFKEALALYDLVGKDNIELMVMKSGHAIIQAVWDKHTEDLVRTVMQAIAPGKDAHPMVSITRMDGCDAYVDRFCRRSGHLVNIHHDRIPLSQKRAEWYTSQPWSPLTDQSNRQTHIAIVEIRNTDPSPHISELKPGRRLVPWHDVCKGKPALRAFRLDSHGDLSAYVTTEFSLLI